MEIPEKCKNCPVAKACFERLDSARTDHRAAFSSSSYVMDVEVLGERTYNTLRGILFNSYLSLELHGEDLLLRTYADFPQSLTDQVFTPDLAQKLALVLDKSEEAVAVHSKKLANLVQGCSGIIQRKFVVVEFGPVSCGSPQMAAQVESSNS